MPDNISVIDIDLTDRGHLIREFVRIRREFERIPRWIMFREGIDPGPKFVGREMCSQNHLFVNDKSRFCHQCGEPR